MHEHWNDDFLTVANLMGLLMNSSQGCRSQEGREAMATEFFRSRRVFGNFNGSSENFRTSAVGKDKGFELYRKIVELAPLI